MPEFPVAIDPADWVCPLPLRETRRIVLGHGGGGVLSEELIENLFLPAFGGTRGATRDSALLDVAGGRIALTTDSYVVQPLFFPGGNIGNLAVNGTINDLACSGAQPIGLTAGFILEEGLELDVLGVVAETMGRAAAQAGVNIVTGDTKVVAKGGADQLFVNTAGVGLVPPGLQIGPERARPGDHIIVSGNLGEHGVAIMSVREGIDFGTVVTTDSTPLHRLVAATLDAAGSAVHVLRDPTRGGLVASLVELARAASVGVELELAKIPIPETVSSACSFLGLDPLQVANEGKMVAFVDPDSSEAALAAMRSRPEGADAAIIGRVVTEHPGMVVGRTAFGTTQVIERQLGEQLPRIC
ncbi:MULTISPECIES: hydrogenase expression/formation protein HypE [Mycobacterium]|uniref:Hydrogenase expression/formation protein HypE n=2 Tax=Mycobacterium kiyosense TaxID=2871094 RepID=A0A9P3UXA0_9MYCO|nr:MULTISPECIES: hydrogenase expression/formation protein HypE [Mycobacterium]BDB41809.1 hydrogenase expression/formation protein HypE [Mycobacterium kiyosense]BDE14898.1 hydrogenase expression/formation protein HypE [Mycobacterium sp. 20KCMC460]GLB82271.1 hydrogenase expression/formation protein HypE [Mycobacterium kiyosense]GLB89322.1 hydrogenase expression/formation protein HypE [Mycobacterium kiyosense]GLB95975.1 hydrogenase expression/formation protein HypE [Mycobacterium kiyosense]